MNATVKKSSQGAPNLALFNGLGGSMLVLVGLLRFCIIMIAEDPRGTSPFANFPWTTIGMLHLLLAWTLWKGSVWYWVPNLFLLSMWVIGPIMAVAMIPHSGGPPSGMAGPGPGIAILVLGAFVVFPVGLIFFQWTYLARNSEWIVPAAKDDRFSPIQFLCFYTVVSAIIGLDLLPNLRVQSTQEKVVLESKQEQAKSYLKSNLAKVKIAQQQQERIEAVDKLTEDLIQGVLKNDSNQVDQAQEDLIAYWQSRKMESEAAVSKMLEHPDVRVRREALKSIDKITRNRTSHYISNYLSIQFRYRLLAIVEDSNEDLTVREQAVLQLARSEQIGTLCWALSKMGSEGHFAKSTLTNFLGDPEEKRPKSKRELKGLLDLLESWEPNSAAVRPTGAPLHDTRKRFV